jgi:hypothetical protein
MKFLCVPCDTPMKLQTVGPPERGSLAIIYSCPECGYEMAMLTNAYETQMVQSLGVRIGPADASASAGDSRAGAQAKAGDSRAEASAKAGCPFAAMLTTTEGAPVGETHIGQHGEPIAVRWTTAAEARLANIPEFVRPMARTGIEKFARDRGAVEVDEPLLDEARAFFGM